MRLVVAALVLTALPAYRPTALHAQVRLTQDEALRLAFPAPATIERRTAFLAERELSDLQAEGDVDPEELPSVVTYYVGIRDGQPIGVAYFDAHRVRSMREVLMIVVGPDDRVRRVEVLAFQEPPEYEAPAGWLAQFRGHALNEDLSLKRGIVPMAGATLTSRAVLQAVRRVLALHRVIQPLNPEPASQ